MYQNGFQTSNDLKTQFMYIILLRNSFKKKKKMRKKLTGGLQSGFLDQYIMVSVTISYNRQGGQKRHGCLTCLHLSQASLITAYI